VTAWGAGLTAIPAGWRSGGLRPDLASVPEDPSGRPPRGQRHAEQVRLLQRYAKQAFEAGDDDYLGEVAAKLRLLAVAKPHNDPLLIQLMTECRIGAPLVPKPPPPGHPAGKPMTLADSLTLPALKVTTSAGDVRLSKRQFIEVVAEKYGGTHEDWAHPEHLTLILALWRRLSKSSLSHLSQGCLRPRRDAFRARWNSAAISNGLSYRRRWPNGEFRTGIRSSQI
jgi:hypothetical protein